MKKSFLILVLVLAVATCVLAVPQYISYQGVLKNSSGQLQNGTVSLGFKLFSQLAGGSPKYEQAAAAVVVTEGIYTAEVGPIPSPETLFTAEAMYLEVLVNGNELAPRLKINSVAYAFIATSASSAEYATLAGSAITVSDGAITTAKVADNSISEAKILDNAVTSNKIADANITSAKLASNLNVTGVITADAVSATTRLMLTDAGTGNGTVGSPKVGIVGKGTLNNGSLTATVYNSNIKSTSYVIVSPYNNALSNTGNGLRVSSVADGSFVVATWDATPPDASMSFVYLIVN